MVDALRNGSRGSSGICRRRIVTESKMDEERSEEAFRSKEKLVWPMG